MKRSVFTIFLALVMVLSMGVTVPAAEAGDASLTLAARVGAHETQLQVCLTGADGVTNGRMEVRYDPDAVVFVSAQSADVCGLSSVNSQTPGRVSLAWVGSLLPREQTRMLTLRFAHVTGAGTEFTAVACAPLEAADCAVSVTWTPFRDIAGHWAEDGIVRAYNLALVNGVGGGCYAPQGTVDRAMFVTMLYRMAGSPHVSGLTTDFTDVKEGSYYADAVAWAVNAGVVRGLSTNTFAPGSAITRQQMLTMLCRYAEKVEGRDVSVHGDLSVYPDGGNVAGWAVDAVQWAVASGLVVGYTDGTLRPGAGATRAQAAVMLCRYLDLD